jgi:hypothetical protein
MSYHTTARGVKTVIMVGRTSERRAQLSSIPDPGRARTSSPHLRVEVVFVGSDKPYAPEPMGDAETLKILRAAVTLGLMFLGRG